MSGSGSLVPFATTPSNLRIPLMSFEIGAPVGTGQTIQRALLVGYSLYALPFVPILVTSLSQAAALVGPQSMLGRMVKGYLANDPLGEMWMLPVAPAATDIDTVWSMSISGTAASTGTIALYVGGLPLSVTVDLNDTAQAVVAEFAAAADGTQNPARTSTGPSGAANAAAFSFQPYRHSAAGEAVDVRINLGGVLAGESIPTGLAVSLSKTSSGVGTPNFGGIAAVLGQKTYDFICSGFVDSVSLGQLQALLSDQGGRWSPSSMLYGHVWTAVRSAVADLVATLQVGGTQNNEHTDILGCNSPTSPWETMAATMASCAVSLRNNPTLPLQTLAVIGPVAPPDAEAFTRANQQQLLSTGIALVRWDSGGNCLVERMVTTYQYDANGNPDLSYLDTETLYQLMSFVRTLLAACAAAFGRVGLADNGTRFGQGVPIVTPNDIRNEIVAQYQLMELQGLVEDTAAFAAGLIVARNALDPSRVDVLLDPNFVSGLRLLANLVQFTLSSPTALAA